LGVGCMARSSVGKSLTYIDQLAPIAPGKFATHDAGQVRARLPHRQQRTHERPAAGTRHPRQPVEPLPPADHLHRLLEAGAPATHVPGDPARWRGRGHPLSGTKETWLAPFDSALWPSRHWAGRGDRRARPAMLKHPGRFTPVPYASVDRGWVYVSAVLGSACPAKSRESMMSPPRSRAVVGAVTRSERTVTLSPARRRRHQAQE